MKRFFTIFYWSAMVPLVALMLWSAMGSFSLALFLSIMLLPGVLFFKYMANDISYKNRGRGVLHTIYFVAIVTLIEYLGIFFVYLTVGSDTPPGIVMNPLFLWLLPGALLSMEYLLKNRLKGDGPPPREKFITFTSDRRRITLETNLIRYIESRDYEVMVVVGNGTVYPTRMKISQWEMVLDDRFVRVHRSFIVNRSNITRIDAHRVWLGDLPIEISRKYREKLLA
jgi:hypothetical protein